MELSWSTFLLEIINFLVLVWILKRFLYKPVLDVIARRRAGIEKTLAEASDMQTNAENMKKQYESRLTEWSQERQQQRQALALELDSERASKMEELHATLDKERQKARVSEERRQAEGRREIEQAALDQGARFAGRLLGMASGPELETRLVDMVIDELGQLPDERITALRSSYGEAPASIAVASAYPLAEKQRQRLEQALAIVTKAPAAVDYQQDSELLAGVRITVGAWVLGANIHDELQGFSELSQQG